jgi:hypothetical protein
LTQCFIIRKRLENDPFSRQFLTGRESKMSLQYKTINIHILNFFLLTCIVCVISVTAFCHDCGKKTLDTPQFSANSVEINLGRVQSIEGQVFFPDGTIAKDIIIEVHRININSIPETITNEFIDSMQTEKVTARYIRNGGKFCFKQLEVGNYLLRIGTKQRKEFSLTNVFVTLSPNDSNALRKPLIIDLSLAI